MGRLDGQVAVITGAASGIGEAVAARFAAEGAKIVVADIDTDGGTRVARNVDGTFTECDVTREADLAGAVDLAVSRYGGLNCFVGNAGIEGIAGPITDLEEEGFDQTVAVLFKAVAFGMKHACRVMRAGGTGGTIISMSSVAGLMGGLSPHVYSACKAAIVGLTRSVALEQGRHGIRVNCINPGGIDTPALARSLGLEGEAATQALQQVAAGVAEATPLGRIGLPADVAGAAVWLASAESAYVTGHALVVDGGMTSARTSFNPYRGVIRR